MTFIDILSNERINSVGRIGRPHSDATKALYVKRLERFNPTEYKNNEELLGKIQELFPNRNTQLGYFSAILAYYEGMHQKENIQFWETKRKQINQEYMKEKEDGILPSGQKENLVKKSLIQKLIKKTKDDIKLKPDRQLHQILLFLLNYTTYPFRNELATIKKGLLLDFNENPENYKQGNWLMVSPKPFSIKYVFNEYKTAGSYQQRIIDIMDKTVRNNYRIFLQKYPIEYGEAVFIQKGGNAMNNHNLTQVLQKYTQKTIEKKISTTLLRKIYYSSKYDKVDIKELKEDARVAGHSVNTAQNIYIV
jgi:hypothetical protein